MSETQMKDPKPAQVEIDVTTRAKHTMRLTREQLLTAIRDKYPSVPDTYVTIEVVTDAFHESLEVDCDHQLLVRWEEVSSHRMGAP